MIVVTIVATKVRLSAVGVFDIDHLYFPLTLLFQRTDLPLFFKPAQEETPFYFLNFKIIFLVDPGDLHIPSSFHGEFVKITTLLIKPVIIIPVIKIPLINLLIVPLIVLLVILLTIALIVSLINLSVIPGAGLCLGHGECSNCE